MDYSLSSSSTKGKEELKMIIKPTTNLETQFFREIFRNGGATIETTPGNSDEITITYKEKIQPVVEDTSLS